MRKSHITLRIDSANLEKIKDEAQKKNVSVNVLINQALDLYTSWYSYAPQAGVISMWKELPKMLLEKHTHDEIEKIAKEIAKTEAKDTALLLKAGFDHNSFIEIIKKWLDVSGFPYKHEKSESADKLVMQFDLGEKWSFYIAKCYETIFEDLGVRARSEFTDTMVVIDISKS